jgi:restriction system protein
MKQNSRKTGKAFTRWFGPTLDALRQMGGYGKPKEVVQLIAKNLNIPDHILEEKTKTGILRFQNQVAWARQYLVWEGYLDDTSKGVWKLTPEGYKVQLNEVDIHQKARKAKAKVEEAVEQEEDAPDVVEAPAEKSLLQVLQSVTPKGFENICKRLLRVHGFENVVVTGGSHDGGIDGYGTLELNPLVSIKVLFQCKRYKGTVSRSQVGDFRNAMLGRAEKGIILTTGTFSEDAKREAAKDGAPPIELIDGDKLVELFEAKQLGVKPKVVYEVDLLFFEPFMQN